jgi:hypothetical protein
VREWGALVENKAMATMMGIMQMGPAFQDGGFFPIMAQICPMHAFYNKGMCGPSNEHCQVDIPALGEDVAYIMQSAFQHFDEMGSLSSGAAGTNTPMSGDTKSDVTLQGSISTLSAKWQSMFLFPSAFLYAHDIKKVYSCAADETALFSAVKHPSLHPHKDLNDPMVIFANQASIHSKVPKLWNMQQALGFQIELMKLTKSGFFSAEVTAKRDIQFLHVARENSLYARDCEFPDSDALIWEPVSGDAFELGMAYYAAHPSYDATRFDPNQPLDWLVKAQNYYPAVRDPETGSVTTPASWNGTATLNNGFKELKMYGKLEYGMVKKILADVDCTLMFVAGWAHPDSPTVPFPPSRDFTNTGCTLPVDKEWATLGRSARSKYAKKSRHPVFYQVWDAL